MTAIRKKFLEQNRSFQSRRERVGTKKAADAEEETADALDMSIDAKIADVAATAGEDNSNDKR